jgi:IS6 family transposase
VRGEWGYLYRAIDKHGNPVDLLLTANFDLDAAKRFFRNMLADQPLLAPDRIGTDGASTYPSAIVAARSDGLLPRTPVQDVTKHLQQGIESDHFRVKKNMPRIGGFRSFRTARRTICGYEAMLWLRKGFGFAGAWTVREQNHLLAVCSGFQAVNKTRNETDLASVAAYGTACDRSLASR